MEPPVSVIIPAYNEEETILEVIERVKATLGNCEVIVIDDASVDDTYNQARSTGAVVLRHPYNMGYGAAIKSGIRIATSENLGIIDADGEHPVSELPNLLKMLAQYDMAVGARRSSLRFGLRPMGRWLLRLFGSYLIQQKIEDLNCGFRVFKKSKAKEFLAILPNSFSFSATLTLAFLQAGYPVGYLPIKTNPIKRRSKVRLRDGINAFLLLLRMTMLFSPLRVFMPISFFLFILGVPKLVFDILERNITDITIVLLLAALGIFCFGLLADQLSLMRRWQG